MNKDKEYWMSEENFPDRSKKNSPDEDVENRQIGTNFRMGHPEDVVLYKWMQNKLEKSAYSRSLVALAKAAEDILGTGWQHNFYIWLETCRQK